MKLYLVVKGDPTDAELAIRHYLPCAEVVGRENGRFGDQILHCEVEPGVIGVEAALASWFGAHLRTPFPPGALLLYRERH